MQLSSDQRFLDKTTESAFVRVDKNFSVPTKFPAMGYGPIRVAPYAWPGSKRNEDLKGRQRRLLLSHAPSARTCSSHLALPDRCEPLEHGYSLGRRPVSPIHAYPS